MHVQDDAEDSLAARLAKKYYGRLFKEYCIADLSKYKESKLGLRYDKQQSCLLCVCVRVCAHVYMLACVRTCA